jgi:hypothetical protein
MQRYQKRKAASKAKATNFNSLLEVLRSELGPSWGFYREFPVGGVKVAMASGESISAWVELIEPLV